MKTGLETPILPAGEAAARRLAAGGLVPFPTEAVYGPGADAGNATAIVHLYSAKGRPAFNPLITHVADLAAARRIGRFDACALSLAEGGPVTDDVESTIAGCFEAPSCCGLALTLR